jgi:hypothetical protein
MKTPRLVVLALAPLLALPAVLPGRGDAPGEPRPVEARGRGTLKGRVTLAGKRPDLAAINRELYKAVARRPEFSPGGGKELVEQQRWRINAGGGVANVVVFLMPPEGHYFPMAADDLDPAKAGWPREVALDTPLGNFVPHVAVIFPAYRDPRAKQRPRTRQVFRSQNTATFAHANSFHSQDPANCAQFIMAPGAVRTHDFVPNRLPIIVHDNIYPWMRAFVWAFEHPYAAVTDEEGDYVIPHVPAGVPLRVQAWHEEVGWLADGLKKGDPIEVPVGGVKERAFTVKVRDD